MRLRALDLFCGAGGASMGLARAGFDVTGVDIAPQPRYPFRFIRADALSFDTRGFELVWLSPKCQFATAYRRRPGHVRPSENMIPAARALADASGAAWVIENVEGAREHLRAPVMLCGSMFEGLDVRRHRLFEASFPIPQPACNHGRWTPRYPGATNRPNLRKTVEVGVYRIPIEVQRAAMGIDWMRLPELSQAIPPAYAEHIGRAAVKHITQSTS